jgi:hypothetical protein
VGSGWGTVPGRPQSAFAWTLPRIAPPTPGAGSVAEYLQACSNRLDDAAADEPRLVKDETPGLTWLGDVYSLVARDRFDAAIDILFRNVDALLLAGQFDRCDDLLRAIDLKRLDTNLLVGALSITLSAADKLPGRAHFVERVARHLESVAPGRVERLLVGLR